MHLDLYSTLSLAIILEIVWDFSHSLSNFSFILPSKSLMDIQMIKMCQPVQMWSTAT